MRPSAPCAANCSAEALVRRVRLGDDEQPGRTLVETVHDARPLDAADARQAVAAVGDERVDERAGGVPGGGMHDEVRRLVDDDEVAILVDDVERDRLGGGLRRARGSGTTHA